MADGLSEGCIWLYPLTEGVSVEQSNVGVIPKVERIRDDIEITDPSGIIFRTPKIEVDIFAL